jgi:hypothetical protein
MFPRLSLRSCAHFFFGSSLLLQAPVAAAAAQPADVRLPDSPALQALLSSSVGRDDAAFALIPNGRGYAATVRGGARAAIREGAVEVAVGGHRWGLSAAAIGRQGNLVPFPRRSSGRAAANRVDFTGHGVEAWFVNGPSGLEQGWTIHRRPPGEGELRVALALAGDLRTTISADGRSAVLAPPQGGELLRYACLAAYDAHGRALAARFELGEGRLVVRVRDAGAIYPVTVDPFVQVAKLLASDGAVKSFFGSSVAASSDGSTVVVGAPGATIAGRADQGAAYVFVRPAGGWASATQTAKLTASDGAVDDELGGFFGGIAVSADGSTVVVSAPSATVSGHSGQGAAYVFARPGAAWVSGQETAKLTASDGAEDDDLGFVAVSGDGSTVVAGAGDATVLGDTSRGAAYVFVRTGAAWVSGVQTAKLISFDGAKDDGFGGNVAISTDGATIAAGASGATISLRRAQGAAYVFIEPPGGWATGTQAVAKLTSSDGSVDDGLGFTTSISGDGSTVVAGANGATISGHLDQGALYVFVKPAAGWASATQTAKLIESDGAAHDEFGDPSAVSGDGSTIVGGAGNATISGHADQGAAYVFVRPAAGWANGTEAAKLTAADGAPGDELGTVAVSGDGSTVFVGAVSAAVAGNSMQGAAYVFTAGGCSAGATTLCINDQPSDRRWQVTASYSTAEGGGSAGSGQAIPLATLGVSEGGLFWFFDSTNPEMLLKVINGCSVNQNFWVFSSATTNVGFTVTVKDTKENRSKVYSNKDGTAAPPVQDTSAFACTSADDAAPSGPGSVANLALRQAPEDLAARSAPPPAAAPTLAAVEKAACATTATELCINGRFQITAHYHTAQGGGSAGAGQAIGLQSVGVAQGGLFWFFAADNPEMLVKVLDACSLNDKFWLFYAAGTNVAFTLTVTDTTTGKVVTYHNDDGTAAPPVQDTSALPCG